MKKHGYMTGKGLRNEDAARIINRVIDEINNAGSGMACVLYLGHKQMRALHRISNADEKAFDGKKFLNYLVVSVDKESHVHLARRRKAG